MHIGNHCGRERWCRRDHQLPADRRANDRLTCAVKLSGSLEISVGMETFLVWSNIAREQLALVRAGRAEIAAAEPDQRLPLLEKAETAPAMLAITAAVSAIDGFAAVAEAAGVGERPVPNEESRAGYVWETLRRGFDVGSKTNDWPTRLKEVSPS